MTCGFLQRAMQRFPLAGEGQFIAQPEATGALGLLLPWQALHLLRNAISVSLY